jgi:hypothetical protein
MRESSEDPPTSRLVDGFRLSGVLAHVREPPVKSLSPPNLLSRAPWRNPSLENHESRYAIFAYNLAAIHHCACVNEISVASDNGFGASGSGQN